MPNFNWIVPIVSLAGACIIAYGNYKVQWWRYKLDRVAASIDQICNEINSTSDAAVKYWHLGHQTDDSITGSELVGRQMRIQALVFALDILDPKLDLSNMGAALAMFYELITGGSWQEPDRQSDPRRARRIQGQSAEINRLLRSALAKRMIS